MKFTLVSPCKHCLTKPMCKSVCKDFINYGEYVHDTLYVSYMIFLTVLISGLIYGLYILLPNSFVDGMVTSLLIVTYVISSKLIMDDCSDIFWQQVLCCVFGPIILLASYTWGEISMLDKPIDNYVYKHIKKHQPDYPVIK